MKKKTVGMLIIALLVTTVFCTTSAVNARSAEKNILDTNENNEIGGSSLELRIETTFGIAKAVVENTGNKDFEHEMKADILWGPIENWPSGPFTGRSKNFESLNPEQTVTTRIRMLGFGPIKICAKLWEKMESGDWHAYEGPIYKEGFLLFGFFIEK